MILTVANALTTFTGVILPRHTAMNRNADIARCVAAQMHDAGDLFLATEWNWSDYLRYFHKRDVVSLIAESAFSGDKTVMLQGIRQAVYDRRRQGKSVYIVDFHSYPEEHVSWLTGQTGLTMPELETFSGEAAGTCDGLLLLRLSSATP
jgi:hypothetical protein